METELEDVVGFVAGFLFDLLEGIDVIRVQYHWLLTNHIASETKTVTNKCVMCVIRRANTHPIQRTFALHLLGTEAVEQFVFREEGALREKTVQATDAVEPIICGQQVISGILDRL